MNMQRSDSIAKLQDKNVYGWADIGYNAHPKFWTRIFKNVVKTIKEYEEVVGINTYTTSARHTQGGQVTEAVETQGYSEKAYICYYDLSFLLSREEINQNKGHKVSRGRAGRVGEAHHHRQEMEAADIFANLATSLTRGDGVSLLNTAHPTYSAGTQSNFINSQLNESALNQAWKLVRNMKDGSGNYKHLTMQDLIVNPHNFIYGRQLLETAKQVGTNNNDKNVISSYLKGVYDNMYIDSEDFWGVTTNLINDREEGGIMFEQGAPYREWSKKDGTIDMRYVEARAYVPFIGNWRSIVGYAA